MSDATEIAAPSRTAPLIRCVRNKRIILDSELASLYGVPTKRLNEQLRRNLQRFPEDFAFQLTAEEWVALRSQIATLKPGRGGHRKYAPYAFTEHGTLMTHLSTAVMPLPVETPAPVKIRMLWDVRRNRPSRSSALDSLSTDPLCAAIRAGQGEIAIAWWRFAYYDHKDEFDAQVERSLREAARLAAQAGESPTAPLLHSRALGFLLRGAGDDGA